MKRVLEGFLLVCLIVFATRSVSDFKPINLVFLGDIMVGRGVAQAYSKDRSRQEALSFLAPYLSQADLAMANLESPLTSQPLSGDTRYDLRADPTWSDTLAALGLDVLSLVNNHALDSGSVGLEDTQSVLDANNIYTIKPDSKSLIIPIQRLRFAILGFEDIVHPINLDAAEQAVKEAARSSDFVIVSMHWGIEYQEGAIPRQQAIAQALARAGADLIWGHHPHVLQPVSWVQATGKSQPTLVLYSLGNALFDQSMLPSTRQGALIKVSIGKQGIQAIQALPFTIDTQRGRILSANQETSQVVLKRLRALATPFPQANFP